MHLLIRQLCEAPLNETNFGARFGTNLVDVALWFEVTCDNDSDVLLFRYWLEMNPF